MSAGDDAEIVARAEATIAGWADTVARGGRVELGLRRGQLVRLVAVCLAFGLMGAAVLVLARDPSEELAGGAALAMSGAGVVLFGWLLSRRGAAVVVDDEHLTVPRRGLVIPWTAITDAMVVRAGRAEKVQVVVDPEFGRQWYASRGPVVRLLSGVGRAWYGGAEVVPLPFPLEGEPALVAEWLSREAEQRTTPPR